MYDNLIQHLEYDIEDALSKNKATLYLWPLTKVQRLLLEAEGTDINYRVLLCTDDDVIDTKHLYLVVPKTSNVTYSNLVTCYPSERILETPKEFLVKVKVDYEGYAENILTPFLSGKYSEIDREYVDKWFADTTVKVSKGKVEMLRSFPYSVLHKEEALRREWAYYLNATVPLGIELDSIPDISKETFQWMN